MKFRDLPHLIECMYQNEYIRPFYVNEDLGTTNFINRIYINDFHYLDQIDVYLSRGFEVISRYKTDKCIYEPYQNIKLPIKRWSEMRSELPICMFNSHLLKYQYLDSTLYVHSPSRWMDETYRGDLTFIGLIINNII